MEKPYEEGNRWSGTQSDHTVFLPLLIIAVGIFLWFGFETVQLAIERSTLNGTYEEQERLVQNSTKLRKSLEVIATRTPKLASQGNRMLRLYDYQPPTPLRERTVEPPQGVGLCVNRPWDQASEMNCPSSSDISIVSVAQCAPCSPT